MPGDMGIISFDDYDVFQMHSPSVTAISQPIEEIADQVISLLLNRLNSSPHTERQKITIATTLNIRNSTTHKAT